MKKILFGIIALILVVGGAGFAWYKVSYGGGTYYVQITKDEKNNRIQQMVKNIQDIHIK